MIFKNVCFYNEVFEKETADIVVENGKIVSIGITNRDGKDMSKYTLLPGFIDIHIHGRNGGDFSDGTTESLDKMSASLSKCGVTSFCGTTMTLPNQKLSEILSCSKDYMGHEAGAKLLGVNMEGPFIALSKKGAQNGEYVRKGTKEEWYQLYEQSGRTIKLITIAPETFDSDDFIKTVSSRCTVSLGHSSANAKECKRAFECGASHTTHLYNAMSPMTHREAGIVGTAFDTDGISCELICDCAHVCPSVLRTTFKILGEDRVCVISDSMRAAGLGKGKFELGGQDVFVDEGGKYARLEDGTLAASISNVFEEFNNLIKIGIDYKVALKACTINPAKAIGMENEIGSIATGKAADLVFVDKNNEIAEVYVNGILA